MENLFLFAIILVNVLFSSKGFNDESFFRKYQFHVGSIRAGEQFRMISSAFLHVDIMHLAFNMLTLWFVAPVVSGFLGNLSFVLIYFGSLIFPVVLHIFQMLTMEEVIELTSTGRVLTVAFARNVTNVAEIR